MSTSWEIVSMDIHFWHLYDADGISEDGLSLTVLITGGVNFQFRSFCPFGIVILKETNEHFDWLVAFESNGSADYARRIAIQYQGLQTY